MGGRSVGRIRLPERVRASHRRLHHARAHQPAQAAAAQPPTVYRYINGQAVFWGSEATATVALSDPFTLGLQAGYLWGVDRTVDEPALGVAPLHGEASLRWQPRGSAVYLEGIVHAAGDQNRVATTRGEQPTAGYGTFDLHTGVALDGGVMLRVGVDNVADRWYVNALNARNPFTGGPIAEPGRVLFARLSWAF